MRHLVRTAVLAASLLLLSGCATMLNAYTGGNVLETSEVTSYSEPGGVRVHVEPRLAKPLLFGWQEVLGWGVEALIAGNLARVATEYDNEQQANLASVLAVSAVLLTDTVLFEFNKVDTRPVRIRYETFDGRQAEVPLQAVGLNRYEAVLTGPALPLELVVCNDKAQPIPVSRVQQPAAAETATVQPAPPAKPAATKAAAKPAPKPSAKPPAAKPVAKPAPAQPAQPPQLVATLALEEPVGDRALHAGDEGWLIVKVHNQGQGAAHGVTVRPRLVHGDRRLAVPQQHSLGDIGPAQTKTVRLPLRAPEQLYDGQATIEVAVEDARRFDAVPTRLTFDTRQAAPVMLMIAGTAIANATGDGVPRRGEQLDLTVTIKNTGGTPGRRVAATLVRHHPDVIAAGPETIALGDVRPGEAREVTFSLFVRNSYNGPAALPIAIRFEVAGEKTPEGPLAVTLDRSGPRVNETAVAPEPAVRPAQEPAEGIVDVDRPLSRPAQSRPDAVALVVGIERYNKRLPGVSFARRDAEAMKRYCSEALGVPEENVLTLIDEDATRSALRIAVERKLKGLVVPGRSDVFVYFAGHGAPDAKSRQAFLVPFDGDPNYPAESCYSTAALYDTLGKLGARRVTVVLDACFTGQNGRAQRPEALVAHARPLFIQPVASAVPKGVTVFAAAGPDQVSSGYPQKRHGLFTYYFLKALRGEGAPGATASTQAIHDYLAREVARQAVRLGREQKPVLIEGGQATRPLVE